MPKFLVQKRLFTWLLALGSSLVAVQAAAQQPANPALKAFTALPIRNPWSYRPAVGPFQVTKLRRNEGIISSELFSGIAAYNSQAHSRLRFEIEDGRQQQQAQVLALADLQLRGNALHNLSGILFPGSDSLSWRSQNIDTFAGVITMKGQPAGSFWQFVVDNPNQIGSRPLRGEVHNAHYTIRFEEVRNAAAYGQADDMASAVLAAQAQHGFLFLYNNRAVAALQMAPPTGSTKLAPNILWLKNELDSSIQLVLTSTALALLTRPVLKQ